MESGNKQFNIAFVDDHTLIRNALSAVINTFEKCKVMLLASDGMDFIEKLEPGNLPSLVILDVNMPKLNGFETAKWLMENYPEMPILILTMYDSEIALISLLQSGVRGFLKKDIHPRELREAIESVMETGYYYSYNATGRLVHRLKSAHSKNFNPLKTILTENEICFLKFASTEMTYKEIALEMGISPRTIDNYRDSLFSKLNIKSRVGLAMYAFRSGVVTLLS